MGGVDGVREGVGDAVLWGEARQVDSKARARLVTVLVVVVVVVLPTAVLCEVVEGCVGVRGLKAPGLTMTSSLLANYFGVRRTHFVMNTE